MTQAGAAVKADVGQGSGFDADGSNATLLNSIKRAGRWRGEEQGTRRGGGCGNPEHGGVGQGPAAGKMADAAGWMVWDPGVR